MDPAAIVGVVPRPGEEPGRRHEGRRAGDALPAIDGRRAEVQLVELEQALELAQRRGVVVDAVRAWRASVAAQAYALSHAEGSTGGTRPDRATELTAELASDDVAAHSALGSSLARVLRMPQREE